MNLPGEYPERIRYGPGHAGAELKEAVFRLAAFPDALAGLFVISSLLLWLKGRLSLAAICHVAGLFKRRSGKRP